MIGSASPSTTGVVRDVAGEKLLELGIESIWLAGLEVEETEDQGASARPNSEEVNDTLMPAIGSERLP